MLRSTMLLLALSAALAGCGKPASDETANLQATNQIANEAAAPFAQANASVAFSAESIPLSNAELGAFPVFDLPTGYKALNPPVSRNFDQIPLWTGKAFHPVEGKTYALAIGGEQEASYNALELKRNLEAIFTQIGATKIFDGKISRETVEGLPREQRDKLQEKYNVPYSDNPVQVWGVRRSDKTMWIIFSNGESNSSLVVIEEKPFVATAKLVPAEALKSALDSSGKAVIHVNFATDQAAILPDSKPQLDALTTLLKTNPDLRLAINGYTDETGTDAHNLTLSDARAKAVLASMVAAGIDKGRLQAKGFGKANPIAANSDEAGKARNRRVELVKL